MTCALFFKKPNLSTLNKVSQSLYISYILYQHLCLFELNTESRHFMVVVKYFRKQSDLNLLKMAKANEIQNCKYQWIVCETGNVLNTSDCI